MAEKTSCYRCWKYNGQIFRYGEGPQPPLHTKCRCIRHYLYSDYEQVPDPPEGAPPIEPLPPIINIPIIGIVIVPVDDRPGGEYGYDDGRHHPDPHHPDEPEDGE